MQLQTHLVPLLFLSVLQGCEETEEILEIRSDGAVQVTLRHNGDSDDLLEGYPLPVEGPWRARNSSTEEWVREISASFERPEGYQIAKDQELGLEAEFTAVERMPRFFAPEGHPYRSAFLERETHLEIRQAATRTVYIFERTFHQIPIEWMDFGTQVMETLQEPLRTRLEKDGELSEEECLSIARSVRSVYHDAGDRFARRSLVGIYTQGDAALASGEFESIVAGCAEACAEAIDVKRLAQVIYRGRIHKDEAGQSAMFTELEETARSGLRAALAAGMLAAGLAEKTRNAALAKLEWSLTAFDQAEDLQDAEFAVRVRLPGTVVGGNASFLKDGYACWKVKGEELNQGPRVLRVVSVLE